MVFEERLINDVRFRRVCRSVDVSERRGHRIDISLHQDVALFRVNGVVKAVSNVCPHKHEPVLCNGVVADGTVQCPLHGWTYDLTSGQPLVGSAGLKTYRVFEEAGHVWLEVEADDAPPWASW